ncbi:endonuclease [Methylobacterium sp. Leaf102]|nr:endonuclease [Methylobacterium sp. Leaf102]
MAGSAWIWALKGAGWFLVASTLIPFIRSDAGFIRTFDFPRLQVAVASVPILILLLIFDRDRTGLALFAALLACFAYQTYRIFPFTPLHAPQAVAATAATCRRDAEVSLLVANVLQDNTDHQSLLRLVDRHDPDLLLVLETDARWRDALISLRARYPSVIEQPQPNTYGLLFYAKLPLENPQVRFLLQDDVPSIRTVVVLPSGERFTLFGVHPRPPHPGHSSAPRDAELVMVAREVRDLDGPAVVAGDLNDVAWSRTTTLFQKISGLLDPRIGRGLYPTFNAKWPLLRWPLDHIFFSDDFLLGRLERLPYIGSDHFPILISLCRTAVAPRVQDAPEATASDMEAGREAIEAVK